MQIRLMVLAALLIGACNPEGPVGDAGRTDDDVGATSDGGSTSGDGSAIGNDGAAAGGGTAGVGASLGGGRAGGMEGIGGVTGAGGAPGGSMVADGGADASSGTTTADGGRADGGSANGSRDGGAPGGQPEAGGSAAVAATPPMGWNSWNTFGCNSLNETLVKGVADALVSSGMKQAGYQYVNLDDCWMNGRDGSGKILVNTAKFPSGMAALARYIHDKGLKIGLYSTPGTKTCAAIYGGYAGGVGSLGHETSDAQSYASWEIDYLKYDKCTAPLSGFAVMRDALRTVGRPIFFSINPGDGTGCVPGKCAIDLPNIANMWRIGFDINASWSSMVSLIDQNAPLSQYAGPGHWNDPDMLEVGKLANETEDRAHFSMWAIMAAPLLAGNDIRSMSTATRTILTNAEVIAVDQDALGVQGKVVATPGMNLQVWAKKLSGVNTVAVVLFNRGTSSASITVPWSAIGIPAAAAAVRDLWAHSDLGSFNGSYTAASVPGHGVAMLKVTSASSP